jgi:PAS domain S-box-containing protein
MDRDQIRIGDVTLSLDEAEEMLCAMRAGRIDGVVVEGPVGEEIYTFRDPGHPYRLLVEAMGEGAALMTVDGMLCYHNPRFAELVGASGVPLDGRPLFELVAPDSRPALEALIERVKDGAPARAEMELIGQEQLTVPVQLSLSRAALADVPVLCVVATDLTNLRRQEELYRAARLEVAARDQMFAIAAHELRNPLAVLTLHTQLLGEQLRTAQSGAPLPLEKALDRVENLRTQGERLTSLIGKLLDIGTIGSGRLALSRETFDLAELVRGVVNDSRELVERSGSRLALELTPAVGRWDRDRIEQVIGNLISNAAKYGLGGPIRVSVRPSGGVAQVVVEDRGKGIPRDARERIFRPYERVSESEDVPGLGLGLYITAEIVKAHGGSIRVGEAPEGGSRFVVELPLSPEADI